MNENPESKDNIKMLSNELEWREGDMPYSTGFGDYYYSKSDGRLECDHVFVDGNDLKNRFVDAQEITIGELGFGTGLNFLETLRQFKQYATTNTTLDYHSFEINPLTTDVMQRALSMWPQLNNERAQLMAVWPHELNPNNKLKLDRNITLHLHIGDVNEMLPEQSFRADAWYLDGFAPAKNQSMWSLMLMKAIADHTNDTGTFSSYTAAGWVRRNLIEAGFNVQKANGYAGKRDMICGRKIDCD